MSLIINVNEELVQSEERFLIIDSLYSFEFPKSVDELNRNRYPETDEEFELIKQEFESFIRENKNPNLYSVGMYKSYADMNLPKSYEIIFDINNKERFWKQKTVVKYAYNYRDIFHANLWQGHSSHLIIEVIGKPPILFDELPMNHKNEDNKRTIIGICSEFDWEFIRKK
ncbi:hypothetical protein AX016_1226 [Cellulophaga sp. RHA19]|uniref:hypothetical protein n=1 Tax=Cellulophaga sp. RHA19 TaxID=1798237 RepID=UPI000C2BA92F|nr:hypothetical protein [Cellulophaga sp. RHA19]PKB43044.1 hypothetical protein AX016_1226 [Cellulophaga sp. RHA19]